MTSANLYVFTSPTCPHCPPAKEIAHQVSKERKDVNYQELNMATTQAMKKAQKFGVQSVPTIIIQGPAFSENIGLIGVQPKETLHKYLDISLGLKKLEEPKKKTFKLGKFSFSF